jgi:hypothetical protein
VSEDASGTRRQPTDRQVQIGSSDDRTDFGQCRQQLYGFQCLRTDAHQGVHRHKTDTLSMQWTG